MKEININDMLSDSLRECNTKIDGVFKFGGMMMSILKKITLFISRMIEGLKPTSRIDKYVSTKETLDKYVQDIEKDFIETKVSVSNAIGLRNVIQKKYNDICEEIIEWENKAVLAIEKENDELARVALEEQTKYENQRDLTKLELDKQSKEVEKLKDMLSTLEKKLEETKIRRDNLINQAQNAKAKKQIGEITLNLSNNKADESFKKMEEVIVRITAEANALEQLNESSIDEKIKALEKQDSESKINDKLVKLKEKINK